MFFIFRQNIFHRKPCLHCGSSNLRFERWVDLDGYAGTANTVLYRVLCAKCEYAPDYWASTPEDAIRYWNTRHIEKVLWWLCTVLFALCLLLVVL